LLRFNGAVERDPAIALLPSNRYALPTDLEWGYAAACGKPLAASVGFDALGWITLVFNSYFMDAVAVERLK
jgi:hypothetical protein